MCLIFTVDKADILQVVARFFLANKYAVLNISRRTEFTDLGAPHQ
jgi:hypothetical protein